ncbi:MAG: hypothetical protein QM270_02485 [Bacillota bacterium]|nr:hypothetical protein [Bacillota bacterium]
MAIAILLAGLLWMVLYAAHLRRLDRYTRERKRLERSLREIQLQSAGSRADDAPAGHDRLRSAAFPRPGAFAEQARHDAA